VLLKIYWGYNTPEGFPWPF